MDSQRGGGEEEGQYTLKVKNRRWSTPGDIHSQTKHVRRDEKNKRKSNATTNKGISDKLFNPDLLMSREF